MQDQNRIQNYINNFRRHIAVYLKPGIGLACKVYPAQGRGAVLEWTLNPSAGNDDHFDNPDTSVNAILKKVPQRLVSGNLDGITFSGTNIALESGRIVLIKGEDDEGSWSDEGARLDVERIVQPLRERRP